MKKTPLNGWLFLNKPSGITSRKALTMCQRLFNAKKAGHIGTLDPLATGLLPIAFGEACKVISALEDADKEYIFTVRWGFETDTGDLDGNIIAHSDVRPSLSDIKKILPQFTGEITQTPPAYSAIKINGKRAYDLARKGEEFEIPERIITVFDLSIEKHDDHKGETIFRAHCSKGTYIRSLGMDIAVQLGTKGVISTLHRSKLAKITEDMSISLDFLTKIGQDEPPIAFLHPIDKLLDDILGLVLTEKEEERLRFGQRIPLDELKDQSFDSFDQTKQHILAKGQNGPIGFVEIKQGCLKAKKLFNL